MGFSIADKKCNNYGINIVNNYTPNVRDGNLCHLEGSQ